MICNLLPGHNLSSISKDGLNNILSAVEELEREKTYSPIVLFQNAEYVCVYDMVSEEDIIE